MREEWIKGYIGLYKIRDNGEVVSYKWNKEGRVLTPRMVGKGYASYELSSDGRREPMYAHKLVADHFVHNPNPAVLNQVKHKDGDKNNNNYTNLEWTNRLNRMDDFKKDFAKSNKTFFNSNMDSDTINQIRRELRSGDTAEEISSRHGLKPEQVIRIQTGKNWSWLKES